MVKVKVLRPVTVDFETFGIEGRPAYPPIPVGVSIKWFGKPAKYYAWGHPSQNNCGVLDAIKALTLAWVHPDGVLFHNAKFDLDVAEAHLGLPLLPWDRIHDTMFLLFLNEPHEAQALKPAAHRLLGLPPDEQDAVADWLVTNQPLAGVKISRSYKSEHTAGRYIAYAPGDVVGPYANGDTDRTEQLFTLLHQRVLEAGMSEAYDRERKLLPILLQLERDGVPIDLPRLASDVKAYQGQRDEVSAWILTRLKIKDPEFNLDSADQLVEALMRTNKVDEVMLGQTPKGAWRTDKDSLDLAVTDRLLLGMLKHRTQLSTCLKTFMQPWLLVAQQTGGVIYTQWNQTRATDSGGSVGTKTGRLSSTPNFQNIPKEFKPIFRHEEKDAKKAKALPPCPLIKLLPLPQVRSYVTARKGMVLLDRDYSQQELRILGHFEDGVLREAYEEDPWLDVHDFATTMLQEQYGLFPGRSHEDARKPVKNTGFGLIYGMGVGKLAIKSEVTVDMAKQVKEAYLAIFPGLRDMYSEMKRRAKAEEPIRTWGGRVYYCEPPKEIDGQLRHFDYKMLNVLIQGSAADCTKEAVIRYWATKPASHQLLLTVHDELLVMCPKDEVELGMRLLQEAMDGIKFGVPMLSEGKTTSTNWSALKTYDKGGRRAD